MLVDVDGSGPVSISIPPGTYDGPQLAAVVENSLRDAFGDDKKVQLTDDVDEKFTIDIKKTYGDKSTGLTTPIEVNLHSDWVQSDLPTIKDGLIMDDFLTHAQILMTEGLNSYAQDGTGIDATKARNWALKVQGAITLSMTEVPTVSKVITIDNNVNHTNADNDVTGAVERYEAYSNVNDVPVAYDNKLVSDAG